MEAAADHQPALSKVEGLALSKVEGPALSKVEERAEGPGSPANHNYPVQQGEIYWIHPGDPGGAYAGFRQPHVIIQNNIFNSSRLETVITCALSTNLKRAEIPGNVLLEPGEGGLLHQSVAVTSTLCSVEKSNLGEYIGKLSPERLAQILDGVRLLIEPRQ